MTEEEMETRLRHQNIHHQDALDEMRIKCRLCLEGELYTLLEKATGAHKKGKAHVVEFLLDDALWVLDQQIEKLETPL